MSVTSPSPDVQSGWGGRGIGVFDSGVGGLDVAAAISRVLPNERLIYWGDNARVPYGTKSPEVVRAYTREAAYRLAHLGVKAIVVACNTASAAADLDELSKDLQLPIFGMVDAGVKACIRVRQPTAQPQHIVILATPGTIRSQAYQQALNLSFPNARLTSIACPLFVPLVEMGWSQHSLTPDLVIAQLEDASFFTSLTQVHDEQLTVLLGCTHYPLMVDAIVEGISRKTGRTLTCIDGAHSVALQLKEALEQKGQLSQSTLEKTNPHLAFFTDDLRCSNAEELALSFWQSRSGHGELLFSTPPNLSETM